MKNFSIANLGPSDDEFLKKNFSDVSVQKTVEEQIRTYLNNNHEDHGHLDNVYCAAVQLNNAGMVEALGEETLDDIFNTEENGYNFKRVSAFVDGIKSRYKGKFSHLRWH